MAHKIKDPINQGNVSIVYSGTSKAAFTDPDFYRKCGTSGTIQMYGCAICALATYALYKGNLPNTNENV